ncbi:MAG: carboxypeptidase-like regulatory domain-containing protein [Halanaerobiales bacterium]|nr:carboxypeptidase-like regulatory domain-containing protein [Halanaerobiales bacterium]
MLPGCSSDSGGEISKYNIYGTITTEEFNSPIEGAQVKTGEHTTTTDAKGKYSFSQIKAGTYSWEVQHDKYNDFTQEINLNSELIVNKKLSLAKGNATVSGVVSLYNNTAYTTSSSQQAQVEINKDESHPKYKENEIIIKYKSMVSTQSIHGLETNSNLTKMSQMKISNGKVVIPNPRK